MSKPAGVPVFVSYQRADAADPAQLVLADQPVVERVVRHLAGHNAG